MSVTFSDLSEDAAQAAARHSGAAERTLGLGGDLAMEINAKRLVEKTVEHFGHVDILVNNAGGGIIRPFLAHTAESLQETINRNLWTAIWCCRHALPHMKAAGYGRIINIGADSVRNGLVDHAAYNAAKGGVHGMTTGLAREFARDGITVNTVAPCAVQTQQLEDIRAHNPALINQVLAVIPMGRAASEEEVASMVAYLAGEDAAFITGQIISVNGGATML
ncbi:MAG: 2,3-dihydroxy-2,3-dihydro-p-cumate dehydrogenase [Gammaproteobacteria bacterium]|nr:2,3-dihydroxy-2,3-dihydro-p-cumate dehydrogenase [Gammaproteobacteria bacterium]